MNLVPDFAAVGKVEEVYFSVACGLIEGFVRDCPALYLKEDVVIRIVITSMVI